MTYKWEAIAQDLTEERDRLLKERAILRSALERTAYALELAFSKKPLRDMSETLAEARAALKSEKQ